VADFVTDAPANCVPTIWPLSKSINSAIFRFFHTDCHWRQSLMQTRVLQSVNKRKNIQCCQLKLFQCSQHNQILFLNFLVFPLFCSCPAPPGEGCGWGDRLGG
jgi:hypothetical protein